MAGLSGDKLDLAILISGRGSNMQSLIAACAADDFPARVRVVIANRPDAAGLDHARAAGIPAMLVDHAAYPDKAAFEAALQDVLARYPVDMICLAGFMRILSGAFIASWPGRIINIHPSLLPAYKGLDTHARALADGQSEAGCSVHYVTATLDDGPVILQERVPVRPDDTPESLAARVLAAEHRLYPAAVRRLAQEKMRLTVEDRAEIGK